MTRLDAVAVHLLGAMPALNAEQYFIFLRVTARYCEYRLITAKEAEITTTAATMAASILGHATRRRSPLMSRHRPACRIRPKSSLSAAKFFGVVMIRPREMFAEASLGHIIYDATRDDALIGVGHA